MQQRHRFFMLTTSQKQLSTRKTKTYQAAFREGFFRRPCRRGWSLIPLPEGHWVLTKQKLLRWLRGGRCPNGRTARNKEETKQKKHAYDPQPKKEERKYMTTTEKALLRYTRTGHCSKYTCKATLAKIATNMYKCCFVVFPRNIVQSYGWRVLSSTQVLLEGKLQHSPTLFSEFYHKTAWVLNFC